MKHFVFILGVGLALLAILGCQGPVAYGGSGPQSAFAARAAAPVNVAAGKVITASDSILGAASIVTDGDVNTANYIGVTQNLQWIQLDLGQSYDVNQVNLWHYFGDGRTYHDVIVRLSNDSSFSSGVTTVFNNDTNNSAGLGTGIDAEYAESSAGKTISFANVNARYARIYSNGSSVNIYNHYVEVQIWSAGTSATPTPTPTPTATPSITPTPSTGGTLANLALGKSITASIYVNSPGIIVDGDKNTNNLVGLDMNSQWIQINLGQVSTLTQVNLWHYYGDARIYHGVKVLLSNDVNFVSGVTSVYDTTAGSPEYAESAGGKSIAFSPVNAQYVRLYSNGSSANEYNHYVEVEVWGYSSTISLPPTPTPTPTPVATATPTPTPVGLTPTPTPVVTPTVVPTATPTPSITPTPDPSNVKVLFDDFTYVNSDDTNFLANWKASDYAPAAPGLGIFSKNNVTFFPDPNNASNKLMRIAFTTAGSRETTVEGEVEGQRRFLYGTYATRMRYYNQPIVGPTQVTGPDTGDHMVATFFTISPYYVPNDQYGELDFEYLPNAGWNGDGPRFTTATMWNTTWKTRDVRITKPTAMDCSGWHTFWMTVSPTAVSYYIDDTLLVTHTDTAYIPKTKMLAMYNLWLTGEQFAQGQNGTSRTWAEDVDWFYYAEDTFYSKAQVEANVGGYRSANLQKKDTLPPPVTQ